MYMGDYGCYEDRNLGDDASDALAAIRGLPWASIDSVPPSMAALAVVVGRQNGVFQALGYNGPAWTVETYVTAPGDAEHGVYQPAPAPAVLSFLQSKGYTLKLAHTGTNESGTTHAGIFDSSGTLISYGADKYDNKAFELGKKITFALIGGIAAGAALTAAGVIGTGAAGAAPAATAVAPAAAVPTAAAIPAAAAVAPAAAGATGVTAAAAAALPVVSTVAKGVAAAAPIVKTVLDVKAREAMSTASTAQMPIAPPANMIPIASGLQPSTSPLYNAPFASGSPPWLIPAVIGGGLLLVVMMMNRRSPAQL